MDEFAYDLTHGFFVTTPPPSSGTDSEPPGGNQSPSSGSDKESSSFTNDTTDYFSSVLNYINDILMEEDQLGDETDKPCMLPHYSLALQAAERSFYHVLLHPSDHETVPSIPIGQQPSLGHFNKHLLGTNGKSRRRKHHDYDSSDEYCTRRSKQASVVYGDESAQLETIDSSFLNKASKDEYMPCPLFDESRNEASKKLRLRRRVNITEPVDLWTLLTQCAHVEPDLASHRMAEYANQKRLFLKEQNQRFKAKDGNLHIVSISSALQRLHIIGDILF